VHCTTDVFVRHQVSSLLQENPLNEGRLKREDGVSNRIWKCYLMDQPHLIMERTFDRIFKKTIQLEIEKRIVGSLTRL
jgi:hypothetical protein